MPTNFSNQTLAENEKAMEVDNANDFEDYTLENTFSDASMICDPLADTAATAQV